jgi:hypothetical protein
MWMTEYSMENKASEASVWKVMTDVENWKKWVGGLEYSRLDGDFGDGIHEITNENGIVKIKLGVRIRGPLTFILKKLAGGAEKSLPVATKKLSELAEMI